MNTASSIFISGLAVFNMHIPYDIFETITLTTRTKQLSSNETGGKISDESVDTWLVTLFCQNHESPTVTIPATV